MVLLSHSALCRIFLRYSGQTWDFTHLNSLEVREEDAVEDREPW